MVTEGDRTTLQCQAFGIPKPVVYWTRTGGTSSLIRNYGNTKPVSLHVQDLITTNVFPPVSKIFIVLG